AARGGISQRRCEICPTINSGLVASAGGICISPTGRQITSLSDEVGAFRFDAESFNYPSLPLERQCPASHLIENTARVLEVLVGRVGVGEKIDRRPIE